MEHHYYFLVEILSGLGLGHFAHEAAHVIHSWLVMIILIVGSLLLVKGIQMIPRKGQNVIEVVIQSLEDFMVGITGPEGKTFFPYIATLFFYILISNLIGLIPGFVSPTANVNTTLSMALCTFVLTHAIGVKHHGAKYIKHFLGPMLILAPLMFVIEVIGHLARVMSLTMRLFGNIFGKEKLLGILFGLAGLYLAPLPVLFLGILVSFIQAVVFMLLSIMYFAGAMEEAH
ncbi:MAG: F0F1 ATP synthase subunit A [Deltaproteobacteria bacterium]